MFKQVAVVLFSMFLIVLLWYLYQNKDIDMMNMFNNLPYPSNNYVNNIGKYCPTGYNYEGEFNCRDKCVNNDNMKDIISFNNFQSDEWPVKNNNPGLIDRCQQLNKNPSWSWPSLSKPCASADVDTELKDNFTFINRSSLCKGKENDDIQLTTGNNCKTTCGENIDCKAYTDDEDNCKYYSECKKDDFDGYVKNCN